MSEDPISESSDFSGFTTSEAVPGQAESRASKAALDEWLTSQPEAPAWKRLYDDLLAERTPVLNEAGEPVVDAQGRTRTRPRWDWRKALYIAWSCVPKDRRTPRFETDLVKLLGLTSTRTIRQWKQRDPEIEERIAAAPRQMLLDHVADVMEALVAVAKTPEPTAHQDRKLFLEMTGQYSPRGSLSVGGVLGLTELDPEELTDEQLSAIAAGGRARAAET